MLSNYVTVEMPKGKKADDYEIDHDTLKHGLLLFNNEAVVRKIRQLHRQLQTATDSYNTPM